MIKLLGRVDTHFRLVIWMPILFL